MLPNNSISTIPIKGKYLSPDNLRNTYLLDYELGGIGLQDPSQGLSVQIWTLEYVGERVFISAPNTSRVELFAREDITEISLAFDQNMRPFVAFVEDNDAKYWWFDTNVGAPVFSNLPAGSKNPRACLDDRRPQQVGTSDIILAYTRDNVLYFRAQRDRFTIEYWLSNEVYGTLDRVGMNDRNRLQFRFLPNV